ncbi:MAG: hypothetical protein JWO85_2712 [Candidatus Eremiobacteraeota bacterium]|nr:hypothetical protein [Candidatus Eremiobacteraeota bacterium]
MRLRRLGFVCAFAASILAACGSSNLLGTSTTTQSAIRFINGSPDLNAAGGVDVYINGTGSSASATALTYGTASLLSYVNSQGYTITVTPAGSKTASLTCASPSLAANTRYTVVIAGKVNPGSNATDALQCQVFAETIYSLPTGSFQLGFHNASPALNALSPSGAGYGLYANSTPPVYYAEAGPVATFTAPTSFVANGFAVNNLPAGVESAPGMGIYVSTVSDASGAPNPPTTSTVQATLLPSALQPGFTTAVSTTCPDTGNFFPIQTPTPTPLPVSTTAPTPTPTPVPVCTVVSNVMSVYAIDAPTGGSAVAKLVGVTD